MRNFDFQRHTPLLLLAVLVITPLAIWAATSGGSGDDDKRTFYVERSVGVDGEPELLLTVDDPSIQVTNKLNVVKVECTDAKGNPIVKGTQPWPFQIEQGFSAPHAHVAASEDEVRLARRCRLTGTNKRLVAEVR